MCRKFKCTIFSSSQKEQVSHINQRLSPILPTLLRNEQPIINMHHCLAPGSASSSGLSGINGTYVSASSIVILPGRSVSMT